MSCGPWSWLVSSWLAETLRAEISEGSLESECVSFPVEPCDFQPMLLRVFTLCQRHIVPSWATALAMGGSPAHTQWGQLGKNPFLFIDSQTAAACHAGFK